MVTEENLLFESVPSGLYSSFECFLCSLRNYIYILFVYKFKQIMGRTVTAVVINPITVANFAALFNCTPVDRTSDSVMAPTKSFSFSWLGPELWLLGPSGLN